MPEFCRGLLRSGKNALYSCVRNLVRGNPKFFAFVTLTALVLRLFFFFRFSFVTNDSFLYAEIARNWLQHGTYGLGSGGHVAPTLIRLPGYPAFLAASFAVFGMDHYGVVLFAQVVIDIGTCFVVCDLTRRLFSPKAAKAAFFLSAVCPFLANYAAAALTETLEIFFTALALDLAVWALGEVQRPLWAWAACGLAIGAAILFRPDGGLLLIAVTVYLAWVCARRGLAGEVWQRSFVALLVVVLVSVLPLVPWTIRNFHTLHRFQPLAPRYANEEGEVVPAGFNRWVKTWIADYSSVEEIYWNVPGEPINLTKLPLRAFDSAEQYSTTAKLFEDYNAHLHLLPGLDAEFAALAEERIHAYPLRYYVWLPFLRIVDMWMRPRTELVPVDPRWWEFNDEFKGGAIALSMGAINLFYIAVALVGVVRSRHLKILLLPVLFVICRSLFLGTLENPEPRYTLEMYPVVIALCAARFDKQSARFYQKL